MMLRLGLLGAPIGHSLSPMMHERWLAEAGLQGEYRLLECRQLPKVSSLQAFDGFNITTPLKSEILSLPKIRCGSLVHASGAANTFVRTKEGWLARNTDGPGFLLALRQLGWPAHADVLIIGAGGAARGVGCALAAEGFSVCFTARRLSQALDAAGRAQRCAVASDVPCAGVLFGAADLTEWLLARYDRGRPLVVLWAIPADAREEVLSWLLPLLPSFGLWADMNYFDKTAHFPASALHWPFMGGLGMLVGQGALAFELFTGVSPDWRSLLHDWTQASPR